ncbi:Lysosome membrane protein 2 85 kDa lysosomal membrane sialoglycoprotein [Collichthys lucidus]|uniref:Lysosome membrane protein 2 85 kDa lysosomal membrane sialoglycoprotein n=1 Tax=Collichthys lucidus TaxID=240159 RepID=A0A4U5V9Z6_COLLU|nr:Lysosome membrane protein 2 85 kDa lysosomal membrane sialoglycoprotein [Collichthys lucidus]
MTRRSCAIPAVGIIAALLLVAGIGLFLSHAFRTLMQERLKKEIVLVEGSRVFESWKKPPPPVYMEFFFFNFTNMDMFFQGAKPEVQQVGPYTYREYRYKDNVSMVENGSKVVAYNTKSFVFVREKSVGDPTVDIITTVNIPAWAVMTKVKGSFWRANMVSIWMSSLGSGLFTTRTVDELLWGYVDPLLTRVATTQKDVETIFGLIRLTFWTSNQSNSINGSDGSAFHPLLKKDERIYIFTPDLCRSIYMEFEKDVEVKGIPAYRFTPPRSVLASKEENPANEGFCVSPQECLGTGLLKVSPCRRGAPVVASFPHFHLGDSKYVDAVEGMSPQWEDHQTFLDLNPTTGVIVRANKRAQINILISRIVGFPKTKGFNETVFPIMFLNESVVIDDASAAKVQKLLLIVNLVSNFPLIIVGLGALMLAIFIVLLIRARKQQTSTEEETSYTPASDKEKEDPQNGTYIALTAKEDPQA